jgi:hypothetical protein
MTRLAAYEPILVHSIPWPDVDRGKASASDLAKVELCRPSSQRQGRLRSRRSATSRCSSGADVNLQKSDRTAQRIPVYAEFLGSFALIPSLIFQHSKDKNFLKSPYRFRASHPGFIHLPGDIL